MAGRAHRGARDRKRSNDHGGGRITDLFYAPKSVPHVCFKTPFVEFSAKSSKVSPGKAALGLGPPQRGQVPRL